MVEGDSLSVKVDTVGDIVPDTRLESDVPLALAIRVPLQLVAGSARSPADQAVFHLCEMALEETDLVLLGLRRRVRSCVLHREVVEDFARVDRSRSLRDQFCAHHRLAIPRGRVVDCDLDALV